MQYFNPRCDMVTCTQIYMATPRDTSSRWQKRHNFSANWQLDVSAGASLSVCSLCQAGKYWTGSGWYWGIMMIKKFRLGQNWLYAMSSSWLLLSLQLGSCPWFLALTYLACRGLWWRRLQAVSGWDIFNRLRLVGCPDSKCCNIIIMISCYDSNVIVTIQHSCMSLMQQRPTNKWAGAGYSDTCWHTMLCRNFCCRHLQPLSAWDILYGLWFAVIFKVLAVTNKYSMLP